MHGKVKSHAKAAHQVKAKVIKCHVIVNGHVSLRLVYMLRRRLDFMSMFLFIGRLGLMSRFKLRPKFVLQVKVQD